MKYSCLAFQFLAPILYTIYKNFFIICVEIDSRYLFEF